MKKKIKSEWNPKPYTLNPEPYTLDPTPLTLNPTSDGLILGLECASAIRVSIRSHSNIWRSPKNCGIIKKIVVFLGVYVGIPLLKEATIWAHFQ